MLTHYITATKILFTGFVGVWFVLIFILTNDNTMGKQISQLARQTNYLKYKVEFNQNQDNLSLANAASILANSFRNPESLNLASSEAGTSTEALAQAVPVFVYHGIIETPDRFSITPAVFKEQMFALKRAGYEAVKLDDFIQFVRGEKTLPEKSFLLTFDDGRIDSYQQADPVLKALGWSAVMFIATKQSYPDTGINVYYLNEEQIANMVESGRWEIQSHALQPMGGWIPLDQARTPGNLLSNKMWLEAEERLETDEEYRARLAQEFSTSKFEIENKVGLPVRAFAYPFGDYGQQSDNASSTAEEFISQALLDGKYEVAFQQTWARDNFFTYNYQNEENFYRLRRIEPASAWSGEQLVEFMTRAEPKPLPYSDPLLLNQGWKNAWGSITFSPDGIILKTVGDGDGTGAFAFLDGARNWRDYNYSVSAQKEAGGYLTLFVRYQNNDNYASCTFGEDLVRIEEKVNGSMRTLIESDRKFVPPVAGATYAAKVSGSELSCVEQGKTVATTSNLNNKLDTGGIGARIWDEVPGQAFLTLSSLEVVEQ